MTNLDTLKMEAREEMENILDAEALKDPMLVPFVKRRIEKTVDEVEKAVVPPCQTFGCDGQGTIANQVGEHEWEPEPCQFCHENRLPLQEAFTRFRNQKEV